MRVHFPLELSFPAAELGNLTALAAGNVAVVKPAEDTPLSTIYFCHLARQAGVPDGVINVIPGYGDRAVQRWLLIGHSAHVVYGFTRSGPKHSRRLWIEPVPVKLELGGKGAAVLFDDIDLDQTASALVSALTLNTGQVCCTATRWLVHESIWDPFVERAKTRLEHLNIGYSLLPETEMGPVVSPKQKDRILGYLRRGVAEGASALLPGGEAEIPEFKEDSMLSLPC